MSKYFTKNLEVSKSRFIFVEVMRFILCLVLISSCSYNMRVSKDVEYKDVNGVQAAVIYPKDIVAAYEFMRYNRQSGMKCNKTLTTCEDKNTLIQRVTDTTGTVIFIYRK